MLHIILLESVREVASLVPRLSPKYFSSWERGESLGVRLGSCNVSKCNPTGEFSLENIKMIFSPVNQSSGCRLPIYTCLKPSSARKHCSLPSIWNGAYFPTCYLRLWQSHLISKLFKACTLSWVKTGGCFFTVFRKSFMFGSPWPTSRPLMNYIVPLLPALLVVM